MLLLSYRSDNKLRGDLLCLFDLLAGLWVLSLLQFLLHSLSADWLTLHLSEAELLLVSNLLQTELLLVIVVFEIVKQLCASFKVGKDLQHFLTSLWIDLLAVSSLASGLVLIVWVLNMDELGVRNILDVDPFNSDRTWPFSRLLPKVLVIHLVRNSTFHLGYTAEVL